MRQADHGAAERLERMREQQALAGRVDVRALMARGVPGVADFFSEGHFERHVRRMRRLYKARRDRMIDELRRYFGPAAAIRGEAAGMHLTVRFDDAASIRAHADASGVHIAATDIYYRGPSRRDEFILGFSAIGERTIREGIRRIAGAAQGSRSQAAQSLRDTRE